MIHLRWHPRGLQALRMRCHSFWKCQRATAVIISSSLHNLFRSDTDDLADELWKCIDARLTDLSALFPYVDGKAVADSGKEDEVENLIGQLLKEFGMVSAPLIH